MEGDEGPRRRLLEAKRQLHHVVTGIANVGYSPALGDALWRLEAEKTELERCVVQSTPGASLSDTEIGALLEDEIRRVGTLRGEDVEESREARRGMLGGPIAVHPGNEKTPAIAEVYLNGSGGRI